MAKIRYDKTKTFVGHNQSNLPLPPKEYLRSVFEYHSDGYFLRLTPRGNRKAGSKVKGKLEENGYIRVAINYDLFLMHRLIWKWHYGTEPEFIDHINNDRTDNRIENMKQSTKKDNNRKQLIPSVNTSGFIGAAPYCKGGFVASICIDYKKINIGYFTDLKSAVLAYNKAAIEYHGEAGQFKADQNIGEMKHRGWL